MKGHSRKSRLCRVFAEKQKSGEMLWFREYYNPRSERKEVRQSPCQSGTLWRKPSDVARLAVLVGRVSDLGQ